MMVSAEKNRCASSKSTQDKNKKLKRLSSLPEVMVLNDSPVGRFCFMLELGSTAVWDYLSSGDVNTLLQTFPGVFSEDFVDKVSLKAIQSFAEENKTHLGRQCGCDWMRSLDFLPRSGDKCTDQSPYTLDKIMPIFQVPRGAQVLLHALILTKTMMEKFQNQQETFVPVVCPLVTKEEPSLTACTENDVKRAMNSICHDSGSHFFKVFKSKRAPAPQDFLMDPNALFEQLHSIMCQVLEVLMKDKFVRFIPHPKELLSLPSRPYDELAAGITKDGVLCGVFLA